MSVLEEIDSAISAHGQWKHKLREIIRSGESEHTVAHVRSDKNCSFGKWLHIRIDPAVKSSAHYKAAVDLHAKFHEEAAKVLELGLKGETDAATSAMSLTSPFTQTSAALTAKLNDWKSSL